MDIVKCREHLERLLNLANAGKTLTAEEEGLVIEYAQVGRAYCTICGKWTREWMSLMDESLYPPRQVDSTKAISEHIKSDFDSIISRLQGLANSIYVQQGDLSGNKTNELMKEIFLPLSTSFGVDRLAILNENGTLVNSLAIKGERIFAGTNFSFRYWVRETKGTHEPVFSGGFRGIDGKLRVSLTYPIVNRQAGKYLGLVAASVPTVEFFQRYGNIYNISSQYIAALDSNSAQLIHPVKKMVGTSFFGSYTQQLTGHNAVLNNLIQTVMSGKPDSAVYNFMNGQRLNTGYPIFEEGKPAFLFL